MLRRSIVTCLLVLAAAPVATAAGPVATASKICSLSAKERGGSKPSTLGNVAYVTFLSASGTSCRKGKGVARAFNGCRHKKGKAGRCASRVKGYSCTEKRSNSPGLYVSDATCRNGGKRVKFTYSQNT